MYKSVAIWLALALAIAPAMAQEHSWSGIHQVPITEAESNFCDTPAEFASHVIWGMEGDTDIKTIRHDLDSIKTKGFRSVILEAGYGLPCKYLSDDWFKLVRTCVKEAKKRDIKVWIIDEGKYPSGFAGGKFSQERPDLRMQALVIMDTVHIDKGAVLKDMAVDARAFSAVAVSKSGAPNRTVAIKDGKMDFAAGNDAWDILLVGSDFRTGNTRAVNNPTKGKDTSNSICDYLSSAAVRQFIDWTHEQYKRYIGDEFGKTVLGFRGDEPDFAYTPWTPKMVEEFETLKGYDPTPYFASLFARKQTVSEKRFRADYWDVWSELFADNFFKQEADWCAENGLALISHLNSDHSMPACIRAEGNMFRDLNRIQVPGIDAIWNQIWPETINDYPKFVTSISHVYGKPRAFSESFAAYFTSPTIPQAKYVVDYQMVRGINFFEYMFWPAGSTTETWMTAAGMRDFNDYTNRATYLMTLGTPGARVAMYYPTATFWLADQSVNDDLLKMAEVLLQHQRDFDWVDDDAFTEALTVDGSDFVNRSGQRYSTLIIPSCDVISEEAYAKIAEFARGGGKVLYWGRKPTMLAGKSFRNPVAVPDTPDWLEEPSAEWTFTVASAMPTAEFTLVLPPKQDMGRRPRPSGPAPSAGQKPAEPQAEQAATDFIRYQRRVLPDGELYFIFNEGEKECKFKVDFDKVGAVREWDAYTGTIKSLSSETTGGRTRMEMTLAPWESRIITIK